MGAEEDGERKNVCETCPGTRTPLTQRLTQVDASVLLLLVDVGFEQKPITTIVLHEVAFVVLPIMLICDL